VATKELVGISDDLSPVEECWALQEWQENNIGKYIQWVTSTYSVKPFRHDGWVCGLGKMNFLPALLHLEENVVCFGWIYSRTWL
jgi:hypothetical protein